MLKIGDIIENRYKILSLLGRGGMSWVYLVKDNRLDNTWVLKEFFINEKDNKERKILEEHFESEAKLCAKLSHPAIPRVIDYFSLGVKHFLIEEYIEGKSLLELIEKNELKKNQIIPITMQLCEVLQYLHKQNIIYRDLKPDNIMVMNNGNIKLIDFGIARVYKSDKIKDTVIIGTPGFAAPEQYGTAQTDARSDIYSLGALMHHMITGRDPREKPFNFDPPSSMQIVIPQYLEGIIMKSLSLKPTNRYQNIEELKSSLETVKRELSIKDNNKQKLLPFDNDFSQKNQRLDSISKSLKDIVAEKYSNKGHTLKKSYNEKPTTDTPYNKVLILIYAVLIFMFFALLFEIKFKIWILFPYILVAWLLVAVFFKFWEK